MMKKIFNSAFTYTFGALFVVSGAFCQNLQSLGSEEVLSSSQDNKTLLKALPVPTPMAFETVTVQPNLAAGNNDYSVFLNWGASVGLVKSNPILVRPGTTGQFAIDAGTADGLYRIKYELEAYNEFGDKTLISTGNIQGATLQPSSNLFNITFGDNSYLDPNFPTHYFSPKREHLLKVYLDAENPPGSGMIETMATIERHILKVDPSTAPKIENLVFTTDNIYMTSTTNNEVYHTCPNTYYELASGQLRGDADTIIIYQGGYMITNPTNVPYPESGTTPPNINSNPLFGGEWLFVQLDKSSRTFRMYGRTPDMKTNTMVAAMASSPAFRLVGKHSKKAGFNNSGGTVTLPDIKPNGVNGQYHMSVKQVLPNIENISYSGSITTENGEIVRNDKSYPTPYNFSYSQVLYADGNGKTDVALSYKILNPDGFEIYSSTPINATSTSTKLIRGSVDWNGSSMGGPLPIGYYVIEAKMDRSVDDALKNCMVTQTFQKYVQIVNPLTATFEYVQPFCYGDASWGEIKVSYDGGRPPYKFSNRQTNASISENPDDVFKNLNKIGGGESTYEPYIEDGFNDRVSGALITFKEPDIIHVITEVKNPSCYLSGDGSIKLNITGGTQPLKISWSNGASTNIISSLNGGKYTANVTDINGCTSPTSFIERDLTEPPKINVSINHQMSIEDEFWMTADVILAANGGRGGPFLFSEDGNSFSSKNVYLKNNGKHLFYIKDTQSGCVATEEYTLNLDPDDKIEVPQFVSPNGDGYNDTWTIWRINMPDKYNDNEVFLFNSSGKQIAYFKNYDNKTVFWDGTDKNGKTVPNGVYYYVIYTYPNKKRKFTGWIMVGGVNSELDK